MGLQKIPCLYIVIPCYNEEAVLPITAPLFLQKLQELMGAGKIAPDSKVLFVNDGSRDKTWQILTSLAEENAAYTAISLSRNRGHQNALLAGLMEAKDRCDITISIDCDGQDDINAMNAMVDAYLQGAEVVYGVRSERKTDTFFKRMSAELFYHLLSWMGVESVFNHADYRLLSSRVLESFSDFKEVNLYLRGMIPLVGYHSTSVYYERHERLAGQSHYPFFKMLSLAMDGITSLSIRPLRIIAGIGLIVTILSFLMILWVLASFFTGNVVPGWSSSVLCTCLLGGIQLLSLGIIGEYVGKTYMEVKARPRFIVEKRTSEEKTEE